LKHQDLEISSDWVLAGWEYLGDFYGGEGLQWLLQSEAFDGQLDNELPWALIFIGHIGHTFMHLSKREDFPAIRDRLLNQVHLAGARFEAKVAYQLDQMGIQNEFVIPSSESSPDILAVVADNQVSIEITRKGSPKHPLYHDTYGSDLYLKLNLSGIVHTGIIRRPISMNRWNELIEKSEVAVSIARNEGRLVEVIDDWITGPKVELVFAPKSLEKEILLWQGERFQSRFTGIRPPIFDSDLGKRVNLAINGKIKQLPPDLPGIVVIGGVNISFRIDPHTSKPIDNRDYSWDYLSKIEEYVYGIPEIAYVVLQTSQMGRELPEFVYDFNSIWIGRKKLSYKIYDDIVVIRNRFSKHKPIPEIVDVFI
jgi:hypothetical protein